MEKYFVNGKVDLSKMKCLEDDTHLTKSSAYEEISKLQEEIQMLQERLVAQACEGLIIVFQAMDAAGKDGTIKHVLTCINPNGIEVHPFKQPSKEELAHDFLWRVSKCLPEKGGIAVFNRSHYEDVVIAKVHHLYEQQAFPERINKEEMIEQRYEDICHFEKYLYRNGFKMIKIFLHVSKEEQKTRLLDRLCQEDKHWKFSSSDINERQYWEKYMTAYETALEKTSTKHAPWYVVPADKKWYSRYCVAKIVRDTLLEMNPKYPDASDKLDAILEAKKRLENEK